MRPLLRLRDRGQYRFDSSAVSLYRGLHFVVDARGRILHRGYWTGYTAEELVAIPPASWWRADRQMDICPAPAGAFASPPAGLASVRS